MRSADPFAPLLLNLLHWICVYCMATKNSRFHLDPKPHLSDEDCVTKQQDHFIMGGPALNDKVSRKRLRVTLEHQYTILTSSDYSFILSFPISRVQHSFQMTLISTSIWVIPGDSSLCIRLITRPYALPNSDVLPI